MTEWMTHWKRIKRENFELRYFILHKESSVTVISNYIWQTKKSYACEIVGEGQAHSYWSFTPYNRTQDNEPPSRNKGPLNSKICVIPPPSTQWCTQNRPRGKRRQASTEHRCWSITQKMRLRLLFKVIRCATPREAGPLLYLYRLSTKSCPVFIVH